MGLFPGFFHQYFKMSNGIVSWEMLVIHSRTVFQEVRRLEWWLAGKMSFQCSPGGQPNRLLVSKIFMPFGLGDNEWPQQLNNHLSRGFALQILGFFTHPQSLSRLLSGFPFWGGKWDQECQFLLATGFKLIFVTSKSSSVTFLPWQSSLFYGHEQHNFFLFPTIAHDLVVWY